MFPGKMMHDSERLAMLMDFRRWAVSTATWQGLSWTHLCLLPVHVINQLSNAGNYTAFL